MRRLFPLLFVALLTLSACYTQAPPSAAFPSAQGRARSEQATPHYRSFAGAEALSAYLRYGSEAGPLVSAHRGGPAPGYPENALATFERALRLAPALIECDVRLTQDSVLVLLHDETLGRTTTGRGLLQDASLAEVRRLRLVDNHGQVTPFRVPTLREALAWGEGRAVFTLDVKESVPPAAVVRAVRHAEAYNRVVVIVYTLRDLRRYHQLAPRLMLSADVEDVEAAEEALRAVDPDRLMAFVGVGSAPAAAVDRLHAADVRAIVGTFGDIDDRARRTGPAAYEALLERGADVLATDRVAEAAAAVRAYAAPAR